MKIEIKDFLNTSNCNCNCNYNTCILAGIDWSLLSSPSHTYTHYFSLISAKVLSKMIGLKMKKTDNLVSNCSRHMVQPFILEILMSSFERYPSWKITIPRGHLPPEGRVRPPTKTENFYWQDISISKQNFKFRNDWFPSNYIN